MAWNHFGLLALAFCSSARAAANDATGKCAATKVLPADTLGANAVAYACSATTVNKGGAAACTTLAECTANCCELGDPTGKCQASKMTPAVTVTLGATAAKYGCSLATVFKTGAEAALCTTKAICNTNCCEVGDPAGKCAASKMLNAGTLAVAAAKYTCAATQAFKHPTLACTTKATCDTNCCEAADPTGKCSASKMTSTGALGTSAAYVCAAGAAAKVGATAALCTTLAVCNTNCCVVADTSGTCAGSKVTATGALAVAKAAYTCPTGILPKPGVGAAQPCKTLAECNAQCCLVATGGKCSATTMKSDGALLGAAAVYACPSGYNSKAATVPPSSCRAKPECDTNCCVPILPGVTTTPAVGAVTTTPAVGALTTTPGATTTPAAPLRLHSKQTIAVERPEGSNMLWIGVGGFVGMAVLMIVNVLRSRKYVRNVSVDTTAQDKCKDCEGLLTHEEVPTALE